VSYAVVTGCMIPKDVVEHPPHRGMWSIGIVRIPSAPMWGMHMHTIGCCGWFMIIVAFMLNSTSRARACSGASCVFPYLAAAIAAACQSTLLQLKYAWVCYTFVLLATPSKAYFLYKYLSLPTPSNMHTSSFEGNASRGLVGNSTFLSVGATKPTVGNKSDANQCPIWLNLKECQERGLIHWPDN